MAGFETVVRPVVFPSIRPSPKPSLVPQDDPTKGFAVIRGNPAISIGMSYSNSRSMSKSKPVEIERRVDVARVYQKNDDGTINRDNFVDIEVANKIKMEEPVGGGGGQGEEKEDFNSRPEMKEYFYERVSEREENIEIKRKDVIKRNGEEFTG